MNQPSLLNFPVELLCPSNGSLYLSKSGTSLSVEMSPFTIDEQKIEETLNFELGFSNTSPTNLVGHRYDFPSNPKEGYVESSIYIWSVHNPIDLHSITFTQINEQTIMATMEMTFIFEFEGNTKNLRTMFDLELKIYVE